MDREEPGPESARRTAKTVLVVDDEPDILDLMRIFMKETLPGVELLAAASGAQGLDMLRTTDIDLVVSDFRMPGMDGIEFLAQVREAQPHARRVLFTAYADQELDRRASREAGVQEVLSKGASFKETVARIKAVLAEPVPGVPH